MSRHIDYVNSIKVDGFDAVDAALVKSADIVRDADYQKNAFAVDSTLTSFLGSMSEDSKRAVNNTTLLASRAADKKVKKETNSAEWYDKYREVLSMVGWNTSSFNFTKFTSHQAEFAMDTAILEILGGFLSPTEVKAIGLTLQALSEPAAAPAWKKIAASKGNDAGRGSFQINPCKEDQGQIVMNLTAYQFKSENKTERFLWAKYKSSEIDFSHSNQVATLNMEIYNLVKDSIVKKLGNAAAEGIADLDI